MQFYLWLNAGLYGLLALWCTLRPRQTSLSLGYVELNNSGRAEYLVIYGGLQLGLALIFGWLAMHRFYQPLGVVLAVLLYAPLVVYRAIAVCLNRPVSVVTVATGGLELALLGFGIVLWVGMP